MTEYESEGARLAAKQTKAMLGGGPELTREEALEVRRREAELSKQSEVWRELRDQVRAGKPEDKEAAMKSAAEKRAAENKALREKMKDLSREAEEVIKKTSDAGGTQSPQLAPQESPFQPSTKPRSYLYDAVSYTHLTLPTKA